MVDKATKSIGSDLIRSSFHHCGFNLASAPTLESYKNSMNLKLRKCLEFDTDDWDFDDLLIKKMQSFLTSYEYANQVAPFCFSQPYNEEKKKSARFDHYDDIIDFVVKQCGDSDEEDDKMRNNKIIFINLLGLFAYGLICCLFVF